LPSNERQTQQRSRLKILKISKKVLDNPNGLMYDIRVAAERTTAQEHGG
jgi:hypothetical protein